jgi:HEAT repeat protein
MRKMLAAILVLACVATAQTTQLADGKLDFGAEGLVFPPAQVVNGHGPRTAQLLGEAYRRNEPLEWRRVRLIADLGQVARSEGAPFLMDAMKDPSPAVRAEAARSAGMIAEPPPSLLVQLENLLGDQDPSVRREAVLSAATLARTLNQTTAAIERGLADAQPGVIAAALERAWTPEHGKLIAQRLPTIPAPLHAEAAEGLARTKATGEATALLPLLNGDVADRAAAARALGDLGNADTHDELVKLLTDPHPTVRREAITAIAKLDRDVARKPLAIPLLNDPDLTVREAAALVLTPIATTEALQAIASQLPEDYAPLHAAVRRALARPADDAVRQATIATAVALLGHRDARRREDGSYVLGRLRSTDGFEAHLALLEAELSATSKTDWPLVAQAAESMGLIGDRRAAAPLMVLVKAAPDAMSTLPPTQQIPAGVATGNAMVALGRIGHRPALEEAIRLLSLDALTGNVPGPLRTASAFVIGAVGEGGAVPNGINFLAIFASTDESLETKFEALKALGNLRYAAAADGLKQIAESDLSPRMRWMAHWSYERCADTTVPFVPVIERREPPVSISDLPP